MVVTAKQLRLQTSAVLKKVHQVGSLTVTLRGKPVAKLVSLKKHKPRPLTEYLAFGMWADREDMHEGCTRLASEDSNTALPTLIFDTDILIWYLEGTAATGSCSQTG